MPHPHIATRIFNVPIAIAPSKAEVILSALSGRLGIGEIEYADGRQVDIDAAIASDIQARDMDRAGYHIERGVAIIPVSGTLVHKHGYVEPMSGMTGYDGIRHNFAAALDDTKVRAIAFDIDSPGGEVSGCFDLCDTIFAARGQKPTMAILSEYAFSAAYALASACDAISVPRTGGTGSVGVVAMHVDYSAMLEKTGVKVTMIHYGAKKVDGNETQPLSDSAFRRLQADVNKMGELFVQTVARNRDMTMKKVRETEAGIFLGKAGVEAGFADGVCSPNEAFENLCSLIS